MLVLIVNLGRLGPFVPGETVPKRDTGRVSTSRWQSPSDRVNGPWFSARPMLAVSASAVMLVAILVARLITGDADDAVLMLLVFPISLLAIAFGTSVGLFAGVFGAVLIGSWTWFAGVDLSVIGWLSRIGPLLFLGILVGDAADRLRSAAEERQTFELVTLRHQQAIEVNDSLIQGMAAAKWALESGRVESASATLEETIAVGQRLVSVSLRNAGPTSGARS